MDNRHASGHRILSSSVVGTSDAGSAPVPHETVRYVEVPVVKESVIHVPKTQVYEVEKLVPVYDYEVREKVVEVPQLETYNTEIEVEQIQEVVRRVPKKKIVEVPKEVLTYVPKIILKPVEKEVNVPGETILVPKPYEVINKVIVPRYINEELPVVVSQLVKPVISESESDSVEVVLREFEPYLFPVDVYIPRPVERQIIPTGQSNSHKAIDIPPSQFNSLVKAVNMGATDKDVDGLLVKQLDGGIPMLNTPDLRLIQPASNDWKATHKEGTFRIAQVAGQTFMHPTAV